jgi:hypothetical protein
VSADNEINGLVNVNVRRTMQMSADKDKVRRGLGHSKGETTDIYLRDDLEVNRQLARQRVKERK